MAREGKIRMVSSLSPISSTALAPVSGYEPWVMRSMSSVKEAIADGNPVLMRVHCAADYPMEDELLNQRLDMESHSILLIGYSDVDEVFYAVDPWNPSWGGEFHGKRMLSYEDYCIMMVNATCDKATVLSLPQCDYGVVKTENDCFLNMSVGFYTPRGYILDRQGTAVKSLNVEVDFGIGSVSRNVEGNWLIGEYAQLAFRVPKGIEGLSRISVNMAISIEGTRPYPYFDTFKYKAERLIDFGRATDMSVAATKSPNHAISCA